MAHKAPILGSLVYNGCGSPNVIQDFQLADGQMAFLGCSRLGFTENEIILKGCDHIQPPSTKREKESLQSMEGLSFLRLSVSPFIYQLTR